MLWTNAVIFCWVDVRSIQFFALLLMSSSLIPFVIVLKDRSAPLLEWYCYECDSVHVRNKCNCNATENILQVCLSHYCQLKPAEDDEPLKGQSVLGLTHYK